MPQNKYLTTILYFIQTTRPKQWTKNLFVLTAPLFGRKLFEIECLPSIIATFCAFCLISSATYVFNDLLDKDADKIHPLKSTRPIASGKIKTFPAILFASALAVSSLTVAFFTKEELLITIVIYLTLQVLYNIKFKKIILVDIMTISFGFFLRVIAGAVSLDIKISKWLTICAIFLSLLISVGKRLGELQILEMSHAQKHRYVLTNYSKSYLQHLCTLLTASLIVCYLLYCTAEDGHEYNLFTVPFVLFCLLRYLFLLFVKNFSGSPENIIFEDKPILFGVVGWAIITLMIIYLVSN